LIVYPADLSEERQRDETNRVAFLFLGTTLLILFYMVLSYFYVEPFLTPELISVCYDVCVVITKLLIFLVISYVV
jgi:hypothetical protein